MNTTVRKSAWRICAILLLLIAIGTSLEAQTRKLRHRSHSGSPAAFALEESEDHTGEYNPPVVVEDWNLQPFVTRLRKHYERLAKENQAPKQKAERSNSEDTTSTSNPKSKPRTVPKANKLDSPPPTSTPGAGLRPDFLATSRPMPNSQTAHVLWTTIGLLGLLGIPIVILLAFWGARDRQ